MIEQIGVAVKFLAFFVAAKVGKTGLSDVTVDVRAPNGTLLVTGGAATEVGGGLYSYTLASGSVTVEGEYSAVFKTADATVDQQHLPALWVVGRAGVENLDATVSSRSTYAGGDTAGTTTLLARLTTVRADNLDNLDATISSRSTLTAGQVNAEVDTALAEVGLTTVVTGRIDAAISTRSTLTAADVWAHATRTLTAFGFNVSLAAGGLDAVVVETGLNARQALAINASALAGVLAGAATSNVTIAAAGVPATNRISAVVTADGDRTSVTLNPPA